MPKLDIFLKSALQNKASDLHFSSGEKIRVRVNGELEILDSKIYENRELQEIFFEILSDAEKQKLISNKNLDKRYVVNGLGSCRLNIFVTRKGIAAALRIIPNRIPTIRELNFPSALEHILKLHHGLVLVTGPTGSGKSTTLASIINEINETRADHIITIEDPIEYVHECKKSLINQRELGSSCDSFQDALKYSLREDPDIILVGEMRDSETIAMALTAAETGHLVFATLHTSGAAESIDRIIDSFSGNQQAMVKTLLANTLAAVVSQNLFKLKTGNGRVAAFEILLVNHAISNLIREGKTFQIASVMQTAKKEGMLSFDQSILDLLKQGLITVEDAESRIENTALLNGVSRSNRTRDIELPPKIRLPESEITAPPRNAPTPISTKPVVTTFKPLNFDDNDEPEEDLDPPMPKQKRR